VIDFFSNDDLEDLLALMENNREIPKESFISRFMQRHGSHTEKSQEQSEVSEEKADDDVYPPREKIETENVSRSEEETSAAETDEFFEPDVEKKDSDDDNDNLYSVKNFTL
jgi:hypothetical protein